MSAQAATPSAASAASAAPPLALLCGASGFIGRHIACALRAAGWQVRPASRRSAPAVDYTRATHASDWQPLLQGASAVINAVGVLRDSRARPMQALHADAPCALFEACAASGVRRVIHISALGIDGSDPAARTPYARTKRQAEERLLALTAQGRLDGIALRPSLVFGAGGASTRLFLALARLPVLALPRCAFTARVQPLAVWDLAEAVARLAASSAASHVISHAANARPLTGLLELAGPQPLTLAAYIQQLRASQGRPPARALALPACITRASARLGDALPFSPWCTQSLHLLSASNVASPAALPELLGRPATAPAQFMQALAAAAQADAPGVRKPQNGRDEGGAP